MKAGQIPSNQVRGWRRVFQVTLTADNQTYQVDLPRGPGLEQAMIVLDGTIYAIGGTTIGLDKLVLDGTFNVTTLYTAVRGLSPLQLLRRVDWRLNGNITLDSLSGIGAFMANALTSGRGGDAPLAPASAATVLRRLHIASVVMVNLRVRALQPGMPQKEPAGAH